jgi:hypothetical protein
MWSGWTFGEHTSGSSLNSKAVDGLIILLHLVNILEFTLILRFTEQVGLLEQFIENPPLSTFRLSLI